MDKRIIKSLIAVAGVASATFLGGCQFEAEQSVYGVPADITVKNFNEGFDIGSGKTKEDIMALIERINNSNGYYAGRTENTMTDDITYSQIIYKGPSAEELEDNTLYKVEITKYNASGIVSEVTVTAE